MKTPEEILDDAIGKIKREAKTSEEKLLILAEMILADRYELVEGIAKACGSPDSHVCSCGQTYFFIPTKSGRFQPIVPDEGISHFITCRDAPHYRDVAKSAQDTPPPVSTEES